MPRVSLAHQVVVRSGLSVSETAGDAVNNHSTQYEPRALLRARNAHATLAKTVTLRIPTTVDGQAVTNRTVSVPAVSTRYIGPFTDDYRQGDDTVYIDVESSDLNLAVLRVP